MRPSALRPVVAAATLLLAACAAPQPAAEPTAPGDLPVSGGIDASGAMPALPDLRPVREEAVGAEPRPFEEALLDETDGSFHVIWRTGPEPCHVLAGLDVAETADEVVVTVREGMLLHAGGDEPECADLDVRTAARVPLEAPLDERTVVDGATGEAVPVSVIRASEAPAG